MMIISWNVQGLGSWKKKAIVKDFLSSQNPAIVILQETKLSAIDRKTVKSIWSCRNIAWAAIDVYGASGGIAILWSETTFNVLEVVKGIFSLSIHLCLVDGFSF